MDPSIFDPLEFPLAFIILSGIIVGDKHPRESVDPRVGVRNRPGNEGEIYIFV